MWCLCALNFFVAYRHSIDRSAGSKTLMTQMMAFDWMAKINAGHVKMKLKQITISLERHATAADLIWELEQLFPRKDSPIQ